MQQVVETTKKYPPAFADSTYERTYRLLGAWRIKRTTSGGVQWQVTNAVQDRKTGIYYAGRVHGSAPIQPFFAGRGWLKLSDVLKAYGGRDALARGAQTIISTYVGA